MQLTRPSTDTECREVLARYADGLIGSTEARNLLAGILHASGIAYAVAGEKLNTTYQARQDIAEEMQALLYTKMMQETPGGFDLHLAQDTSVTAWARQLLRTARPSIVRNITTRTIARIDLVDPVPPKAYDSKNSVHDAAYQVFHNAPARDQVSARAEAMSVSAAWLRSKNRHLRDGSRLAAEAAAFLYAYGVPPLTRFRLVERKRLQALVAADPTLAWRSVKEMHSIVDNVPVPAAERVDQGLLALWDDYSFDHLEAIAEAAPEVARTLVDAALADRARPSRTVLASFNASVRAMGTGKGWRRLAAEACESFIALEFEAYSAFDTTGAEFRAEKVAGRRISCLKSGNVFKRVLAYPGQRLGLTEDDMYAQLERLISNLTEFEVKEPAAA